jgi:hypothetical protein
MNWYEGNTSSDPLIGGGSNNENSFEEHNFHNHGGHMYGYVTGSRNLRRIGIERLGALRTAGCVTGVTVIWIATRPKTAGQFVVGWYRDATVYRNLQDAPPGTNRTNMWNITAEKHNVRRLHPDERRFPIGLRSTSQVFFPEDKRPRPEWYGPLLKYISSSGKEVGRPAIGKHSRPDSNLILKVERAAVAAATGWYEERGYEVGSVEEEKLGWDLEATRKTSNGYSKLLVEVKGTENPHVRAELTPNEYAAMTYRKDEYRLAVVTQALRNPQVHVFLAKGGKWRDEHDGCNLSITERTSAIVAA